MFESILKYQFRRRLFFSIVGLIIYLAITLPTALIFLEVGRDETSKSALTVLNESTSDDQIVIQLHLQFQDLNKRTIKYYVDIHPYGKYFDNTTKQWNEDIEFNFFHKTHIVKKGSMVEPITFEAPLRTGHSKDYPFDRYTTEILFLAIESRADTEIPLSVGAFEFTQNTVMKFEREPTLNNEDIDLLAYNVVIERTALVFTFCFFISAVTWGLTISILNLAYDWAFLKRDLPPQLLVVGVTMLFAMPALRKTQPGIPEVGCAIDFLCFFWCEILISIASCMILFGYGMRWKRPSNKCGEH